MSRNTELNKAEKPVSAANQRNKNKQKNWNDTKWHAHANAPQNWILKVIKAATIYDVLFRLMFASFEMKRLSDAAAEHSM